MITVKRLFTKSIVISLAVGVAAVMIQVTQKWLLATPSMSTIAGYTIVSGIQVCFSVWFYAQRYTLAAAMQSHLVKQLVTKIAAMEQLAPIKRFGKLDSGVFEKLVNGFGSNLPGIVNTLLIVSSHVVGLTVAFGWKYLVISLFGLGTLGGLGPIALKKDREFNRLSNELVVSTKKHLDDIMKDHRNLKQTGNMGVKSELIEQVLDENVVFNRSIEGERTLFGILWIVNTKLDNFFEG